MKEKPNEFVAISDLMAGVMAVIMLLLVVSVLQKLIFEEMAKVAKENGLMGQKNKVGKIIESMHISLKKYNAERLASFDTVGNKIIFKDGIFELGSAKVSANIKTALLSTQKNLKEFLVEIPDGRIYIEGHTDTAPVQHPVTDFATYGAVYDDNYTLSAARAREARKIVVGDIEDSLSSRIIVAGYGSSKLLDPLKPKDGINRRVEITFVLNVNAEK